MTARTPDQHTDHSSLDGGNPTFRLSTFNSRSGVPLRAMLRTMTRRQSTQAFASVACTVVLIFLLATLIVQIPQATPFTASRHGSSDSAGNCCACCGDNCRCTGDCCAGSHGPGDGVSKASAGPDKHAVVPSAVLKRQKHCEKGWMLPTASSRYQASLAPGFRTTPVSSLTQRVPRPVTVSRWTRPAVSRSSPRAPPVPPLHPRHF